MRVYIDDEMMECFDVRQGVRQGAWPHVAVGI